MAALKYGDRAAREVSRRIGGSVATRAELKATPAAGRVDGQVFVVREDNSLWTFDADAEGAANDAKLVPDEGTGRFTVVAPRASSFLAQLTGESADDDRATGMTGTGSGACGFGPFTFTTERTYANVTSAGYTFAGNQVLTFDDEATLTFAIAGTFRSDDPTLNGGWYALSGTVTDGTGRFEGCGGSFQETGSGGDPRFELSDPNQAHWAWDGTCLGEIRLVST